MAGKKGAPTTAAADGPPKPRDVADPVDFLDTYFRDRGIKRNIEAPALAECERRAEDARESFKRMRVPGAPGPVPRGASAQSAALTNAEKYSRRLVNNRKSAAATRVYQEVLKKEQTHMLATVVEELARSKADRERIFKETKRLQGVVQALQGGRSVPVFDTGYSEAGERSPEAKMPKIAGMGGFGGLGMYAIAPVESKPGPVADEKKAEPEPALDEQPSASLGLSGGLGLSGSLGISIKDGDYSYLQIISSQSSQEIDAPAVEEEVRVPRYPRKRFKLESTAPASMRSSLTPEQ